MLPGGAEGLALAPLPNSYKGGALGFDGTVLCGAALGPDTVGIAEGLMQDFGE